MEGGGGHVLLMLRVVLMWDDGLSEMSLSFFAATPRKNDRPT